MYLTEANWRELVQGWIITDCSVRDKNVICLCLRQDLPHESVSRMWDHDIHTTLLAIYLDTPNDQFGARTFTGYNRPTLGISRLPKSQALLTARNGDGQTAVFLGGKNSPDEFIHKSGWPITMRIKCINGYAYSVGANRKIYKRVELGKWEKFADLDAGDDIFRVGFNDMDAFSDTDMYAVGGHGDIWHYNGQRWQQMHFPTAEQLGTVTCAGDGNVYITGEGGSLWIGRESTWQCVHQGASTLLWNDALWFENRLWLASDYQLRQWNGKEMQKVEHQGKQIHTSGHMDARDGLLVIASPSEVRAYDGKEWRLIVAPYA